MPLLVWVWLIVKCAIEMASIWNYAIALSVNSCTQETVASINFF
ncbi:MAG TPA: hypothetical protein V6D43_07005 [Candidatus Sericytochromatia bacterium]